MYELKEREVKIALVPKEWTCHETDVFRVSCEGMKNGWGTTLSEAIKDFDEKNSKDKL